MSKGAKKDRIHDLSRTPPTLEEIREVRNAISTSGATSPIVAAILGVACIEHQLEKLLRMRLPRNDDKTWAEVTSDVGPLGTFFEKILCGYAFKIYDEKLRDQINHIRTIRNQFAHAKKIITFKNDLIVKELHKAIAKLPPKDRREFAAELEELKNPQEIYIAICFWIINRLLAKENISLRGKVRWRKKKIAKLDSSLSNTNPFYSSLAALSRFQANSRSLPPASPHERGDDPKIATNPLSASEHQQTLPKTGDNKKE